MISATCQLNNGTCETAVASIACFRGTLTQPMSAIVLESRQQISQPQATQTTYAKIL